MILLQLSAGQGPAESCRAVALALNQIETECRNNDLSYQLIECIHSDKPDCYKSALLQLGDASSEAKQQASQQTQTLATTKGYKSTVTAQQLKQANQVSFNAAPITQEELNKALADARRTGSHVLHLHWHGGRKAAHYGL